MPTDLNSSFSRMTGARQTLLSWARVIDSFEKVPDIYKNPYQALVGNTGALPYTVLAPAQGAFRGRKSRERLLCEISDMFYVLERAGAEVFTTGYRSRDICSFEVGNILLYSWFSISGRTNAGAEAASTVEFNEATLRHFEPFFCKMRPAPTGLDQPDPEVEEAKFDYLSTQNFKFMNFARASLAPGERVIQSLYQPRNRQSVIKVLGRNIYRTISPAHLTILTDKEVILIGDVEGIAENKSSRYGGVRRYLPLRSIVSVALQEQPNDLLSFTFNVSPNVQVERLFDAAHLREIDNLKKALETLFG